VVPRPLEQEIDDHYPSRQREEDGQIEACHHTDGGK
jgi:hypothetical protein